MANWSNMRNRITASVRTTSRMNALLAESMINKRRALLNLSATPDDANCLDDCSEAANMKSPPTELAIFRNNFSMERVHKLIEQTVEERLTWDHLSRSYDSWRSLQLAENLAADIRDVVKRLNYRRHRIVCILSIIEKQNQGLSAKMCHLLDAQMDNFSSYIYERPTFTILVTLFLVYKD